MVFIFEKTSISVIIRHTRAVRDERTAGKTNMISAGGSHSLCCGLAIHGRRRFGEFETGSAQEKKEFTSPEQDVQQTPTLQIAQVLAVEADVQRFPRALLDESAHGGGVHGLRAELAAAGIQAFEPFIAPQQKVVQAKILVIQSSHRGARTRIHVAASFSIVRVHSTQAH
jgi:hypothetical protein